MPLTCIREMPASNLGMDSIMIDFRSFPLCEDKENCRERLDECLCEDVQKGREKTEALY